ncbi:MAG: DUF4167 domain-containing protein [Holosporales bacterium]|nr:DUF4167 domain-containing protein [Holosporales bacterium]
MKKENGNGLAHYQSLKAKHLGNAKDAMATGDIVLYEYNMQFAEHYGRVISSRLAQQQNVSRRPENEEKSTVEQLAEKTTRLETQKIAEEPDVGRPNAKPKKIYKRKTVVD